MKAIKTNKRTFLLFLAIVLIMLIVIAFKIPSVKAGGLVYGKILGFDMHESLKPIAWAKIEALKDNSLIEVVYSDGNGYYEMYLPNGYYTLKVSAEGYKTSSINISVSEGSTNYIEFKLEPTNTPIPEFSSFLYIFILSLGILILFLRKRI